MTTPIRKEFDTSWLEPVELIEAEFDMVSGGTSALHINNVRVANNFNNNTITVGFPFFTQ